MKTLTFEIPDEIYESLQAVAERTNRSFEAVALEYLARVLPSRRTSPTEEELRQSRERLRRYSGCVSSGDPNSADNERIDADLAAEYGNDHEEAG